MGGEIRHLLTVFFSTGLITQMPLGWLSDRLGRKKTLSAGFLIGIAGFIFAAHQPPSYTIMLIGFGVAGAALGSIYSLGISYLADCIPRNLLPTGNMLGSISYSLGSLMGPLCGGIFIQLMPGVHFSWMLVITFSLLTLGFLIGKNKRILEQNN